MTEMRQGEDYNPESEAGEERQSRRPPRPRRGETSEEPAERPRRTRATEETADSAEPEERPRPRRERDTGSEGRPSRERGRGREESGRPSREPRESKVGKKLNEIPNIKAVILAAILFIVVLISAFVYFGYQSMTGEGSDLDEQIDAADEGGGLFSGLFGGDEELPEVDVPTVDENGFIGIETNSFAYTEEELVMLQEEGMTANQITDYEVQMIDPYLAIEEFQKQKAELLADRFPELKAEAMEKGSPEYKKLISKTYLSLAPFTFTVANPEEMGFFVSSARETVPYEKLGARGKQLFLKVSSYVNGDFFITVNPAEYAKLNDKGSVVINYLQDEDDKGNPLIYDITLDIQDVLPKGE